MVGPVSPARGSRGHITQPNHCGTSHTGCDTTAGHPDRTRVVVAVVRGRKRGICQSRTSYRAVGASHHQHLECVGWLKERQPAPCDAEFHIICVLVGYPGGTVSTSAVSLYLVVRWSCQLITKCHKVHHRYLAILFASPIPYQ